MVATAVIFVVLPGPLAGLYSPDATVVALAASLIPIAGAFQVFDGSQAVAMGVLRGAGDTRIPVVINIFGYYAVGLPVGLWLGVGVGLGAQGYWWGLVTGLAVVAATGAQAPRRVCRQLAVERLGKSAQAGQTEDRL